MSFVKIEGAEYVRDTNSMGLSNTNISEKNEYYSKLRMIQNQKEELNKVRFEIDEIKNDMCEIKNLMYKLLEK